jgi:hypothetical protein
VSLGFDPELGWSPTPDRVRRDDGRVYRVNRQGLRADREYEVTPPSGVKRIAAFGDSFTFCAEVTQEDCWAPRLEDALPGTEVMNFGVTGYGPDQAWLRYQRDGRPFGACAVLIGYFVEDIDRVVNRFRPFIDPNDSVILSKPRFVLSGDGLTLLPNPTADPRQLRDPRYVEEVLGPHDAWYFPGTFLAGPFDGLSIVSVARTAAYRQSRAALARTANRYPFYDDRGEAFQVTSRVLREHARQVWADGASPVVVIFPGERDLIESRDRRPVHAPLASWLVQAGVPVVDLTDALLHAADEHGIDELFMDRHYSAAGNRIVARHLANVVPPAIERTCGT